MAIRSKNSLRFLIRRILRKPYVFYKRFRVRSSFKHAYRHDMESYLRYSRTFGDDDPGRLIGSIILQYHVVEKGLTMPESRLGFGQKRIISLCKDCVKYIEKYGQNDEQLNHAIAVVLEYENLHKINGFDLNNETEDSLQQLKNRLLSEVEKSVQKQTDRDELFNKKDHAFPEFSESRYSIRNYSGIDIPVKKIMDALELAKNSPSACNRQAWRTYVYTQKSKINTLLELQGGNRGFGHLANKLIIVCGELGLFCNSNERNQVYIDGGIYTMNLLYALHYTGIASCVLNCSFDPAKEKQIKDIAGIKDSEVLIVMITCGMPPDVFKVALSPRYPVDRTNKIIN